MYGLPLVFAIFILFYEFPAGLLVYWITTNLWTVGQGYLLRKKLGPIMPVKLGDDDEKATAKAGAGAGRETMFSQADERRDGREVRRRRRPCRRRRPKPSGPPPRSPRKKKKRSGRRR